MRFINLNHLLIAANIRIQKSIIRNHLEKSKRQLLSIFLKITVTKLEIFRKRKENKKYCMKIYNWAL